MVKLILKLSLIIFLNLLNINLFANDSVVESKSLNDEYADKLRNPEYKYNKLDGKDESLTTSYINSLRSGKWGASDPAWVNLELAQVFLTQQNWKA